MVKPPGTASGHQRETIGLHPLWIDTDPTRGVATYWSSLAEHLAAIDQLYDHLVLLSK